MPIGPRTNYQQNKPTRGLVFGPVSHEVDRSSSGKRLRVEGENVGRQGGSFGNGIEGEVMKSSLVTSTTEAAMSSELERIELVNQVANGERTEQPTSSDGMESVVA
ncbi:unnamed protein product [Arabis nemorensis]|uniref:Uncharacterized protein n=1 Tax=Arabis nemorensis TaxID=586526 RepID=A0A565B9Q5_9BRAS|nr:unnamed protein product [Arabis nemorensis]